MPFADSPAFEGSKLLRELIYGLDKTKKTWWACRAAEFGYKVVLLDGDDGAHIIAQLPPEARANILHVELASTTDTPVFARFMAQFTRAGHKFTWDEQERRSYVGNPQANHSYIRVNPKLLDSGTVLVCDSWTALTQSSLFQFAIEQKLDLSDAAKEEWDGYGFQGRFLDHVLDVLHALPCHVVVIGHQHTYEKYKGQGRDRKLISSTVQPISCSGPHGQKLGKHFSDVLQFKKLSETAFRIDAQGGPDIAGGSRHIKPGVYEWDKLTIGEILKSGGHPVPHPPQPKQISGFEWVAPLTEDQVAAIPPLGTMPAKPVLVATAAPAEASKAPVLEAKPKGSSILLRKS